MSFKIPSCSESIRLGPYISMLINKVTAYYSVSVGALMHEKVLFNMAHDGVTYHLALQVRNQMYLTKLKNTNWKPRFKIDLNIR
jgi:hypothetical protein